MEKEKKMKNEAQLKAMQEQGKNYKMIVTDTKWCTVGGGITIAALTHTHTQDSGVKKPVRYATRVRNKQKKEAHHDTEGDKGKEDMKIDSKQLEEEHETDPVTKGATGL